MTTFYICRHGQTENNQNNLLSGWIDTPLTEKGIHNSESSASKLAGVNFDQVITSDLGRAFITAYLIQKHLGINLDIETHRELREVYYGDLSNQPLSVYPHMTPEENSNFVPPNGESLEQMRRRVSGFIDKYAAQNTGRTVLIVAHDGTINAIKATYSKQGMGEVDDKNHNPNDFVGKFIYDGDEIVSFEEIQAL